MMSVLNKGTCSQLRAAFLCFVVTGIPLFHFIQFCTNPSFQQTGNNRGNLLVQLSFVDSAVGRQVEQRYTSTSSKSYRQHLTPGLPVTRRALCFMEVGG